jgi:hypothetical protein
MPDRRAHRGPHPEDATLFNAQTLPLLQNAVADASWLLSRGYADKSTLKIVGDRYNLNVRQRLGVMRASCSDASREHRRQKQAAADFAAGRSLTIDGYNLLITLESALAGAVLLDCRDGCIRDLASLHGTYRRVEETRPAIELAAESLQSLDAGEVTWLLDRPVANSGRLKSLILDFARGRGLAWNVELVPNPDKLLIASDCLIATSDSVILDGCKAWLNLARLIIQRLPVPDNLINLNI